MYFPVFLVNIFLKINSKSINRFWKKSISPALRSRVTTGFVRTVAHTPPKKKKEKNYQKQIYSLTSFSVSEGVHLTFSFSKYHLFAAKHASILSTQFFNDGFKLLLWNVFKDHLGFLDHLGICFEVPETQFTF